MAVAVTPACAPDLAGLAARFRARFGRDPAGVARAPGRVNLIGEHTDYAGGLAIPFAIEQAIVLAFAPADAARAAGDERPARAAAAGAAAREDDLGPRRVRVWSEAIGAASVVGVDGEGAAGPFAAALAGVARALAAAGHAVDGLDGLIAGDLPMGAGLSSSAALSLALLAALTHGARPPEPAALVEWAREAERLGSGVRCGLLDPAAIVHGRPGEAVLLDARSARVRAVPLALAEGALFVIDTGLPRALAETGYNERRAGCDEAARLLSRARGRPFASLRDAEDALPLDDLLDALPPGLRPLAEHVARENARVRAAVAALERGDEVALGALLTATHASLRDLYRVSVPAIDALVDDALRAGAWGARIHGAGFGGSCLVLAPRAGLEALAARLLRAHRERTGRTGQAFRAEPARGLSASAWLGREPPEPAP